MRNSALSSDGSPTRARFDPAVTTDPGSTAAPGRMTIRSTVPSVVAGIQRIASGTSVPVPRTWRTIGPRSTVPRYTVSRSTFGAAGSSCDTPIVTRMTASAAPAPYPPRRILFFRRNAMGGWSRNSGANDGLASNGRAVGRPVSASSGADRGVARYRTQPWSPAAPIAGCPSSSPSSPRGPWWT